MCICIYVYIYIYIYIYIYMYIHIHIHIYSYILDRPAESPQIHISHIAVSTHIDTRIYTFRCAYIHI